MSSSTTVSASLVGADAHVTSDERDAELLAQRVAEFDSVDGARVGDYVRFADGRLERVSHHWGDAVQTSGGGSFYLGNGYMSFSGGLNRSIPLSELVATDELREGACWFFHHDSFMAHNGVHAVVPCRVFDVAGAREHVYGLGRDWWGDYIAGETVAPERRL